MNTRVWQWTIPVATFFFGVFIGTRPQLDLSEKLTAGDLLNACVTVFIAVVLGVLYNKHFSDTRVEKDLLIAHSREVSAAISTARGHFLEAYPGPPAQAVDTRILATTKNTSSLL